MNLLSIAWKSIRQRMLASSLTALSVALGVALMISVLIINGVISEMFRQSGSGYDLVVGPKGSPMQLILSSVYHIEPPIENLPWRFYEELKKDPRVAKAIPISIGDSTEQGQFPIVGTTSEYLATPYNGDGDHFALRGENMNGPWDAVIGSEVARVNGWDVGSQFKLIHSGQTDHVHNEKFTVTGVLRQTGTPNDRTAFVNLEGFLMLDNHDKPIKEAIAREAAAYHESVEEVRARYGDELKEIEAHAAEDAKGGGHHHHHGALPKVQREVTSIMVICAGDKSYQRSSKAMDLQYDLKKGFIAIAASPVSVMRQLSDNLLANVKLALLVLTGLIVVVSGIGIFVSIYNSMADRRREIGIMRALGARRQTVFSIILLESLLLCVVGGLLGVLLGHGLVFAGSPIVAARSGLLINPYFMDPLEFVIIPVMIVMASIVGFLPAMSAYRTDVAQALSQ
jgi:putative ABC transport system permease protein